MLTTDKPCTQVKDAPEAGPFAMVVQDHIGWVYACARRHLGDASLADDAVQAVFMALWQKRKHLAADAKPIGGWLLRATRYACNDLRKINRRRDHHQRKAAAMRSEETRLSDEVAESKTAQLLALDAAMQKLSTADRDILVARFFQTHTAREVSEHWHISEAAAEKRTSRAVEKLHQIMARKKFSMDNLAIASLLTGSAGTAPSGLLGTVLQGITGNAPLSLTAAHAARSIALHTAHIPAIATAAVVAIAVGVATVVPIAMSARQAPIRSEPAAIAPAPQIAAANSPASRKGVLTGVAYALLAQRDFAWAVETSGKFISGKPGGVRAYSLSARVVRALAWSQARRGTALPFLSLHWLHAPFYAVNYNGFTPSPLGFGGIFTLSSKKPFDQIVANLEFQSHLRPYPNSMRVRIHFNSNSMVYLAGTGQPNDLFSYSGSLNIRPGRAVVLLRYVCTFQGKRWYSAVVLDVERYPYPIARKVRYMLDAFQYFRTGPAGFAKSAAIANAWNRYALAHPVAAAIPAPWRKTFSDGATAAIVAINTGQWPLCSWTPDGQPLPASQDRDAQILTSTLTASSTTVNVPIEFPDRGVNRALSREEKSPNGVAALFVFRPPQHGPWAGLQWTQETRYRRALRVGHDFGKWKVLGTAVLSPHFRRYFPYRGRRLELYQVSSQINAPATGPNNSLTLLANVGAALRGVPSRAIAVGAVTLNGTLVTPTPAYNQQLKRFVTSPALAAQEYLPESLSIAASNVKRYVWITRPLHWLTFPGTFKLEPSLLPDDVLQTDQRLRAAGEAKRRSTVHPMEAHIAAASQATPIGLMELFRKYQDSGNRKSLRGLMFAPSAFDRRAADWNVQSMLDQTDYGLWTSALKRFGLNQMRAAGMLGIRPQEAPTGSPTDWNIHGRHATPVYPLAPGISWGPPGGPMSRLVQLGTKWYLDCNLSRRQARKVRQWMQQDAEGVSIEMASRNAYRTVLRELNKGKIKDAFALRDRVLAEIKKFRSASALKKGSQRDK